MKLSQNHVHALLVMDQERVTGPGRLAVRPADKRKWSWVFRDLVELGWAELTWALTEDGHLAGKGYILTWDGAEARDELQIFTAPRAAAGLLKRWRCPHAFTWTRQAYRGEASFTGHQCRRCGERRA